MNGFQGYKVKPKPHQRDTPHLIPITRTLEYEHDLETLEATRHFEP